MRDVLLLSFTFALSWALALCALDPLPAALKVTSSAFELGAPIPSRHTCDGQDLSPPLAWTGVPPGTRSLALICDDPDAPVGTWDHWVLYNLAPGALGLPEGVTASGTGLPPGTLQGLNGWKTAGYRGPCPPKGKPHRYFFRVYALDGVLGLPAGAPKEKLLEAMKGHVLAQGELMGTYARK